MANFYLWLGFGVAVAFCTIFICLLLLFEGQARGVSTRRIGLAMAQVVVSVTLAIAVGLAVRAIVGGELLELGRTDRVFGFWVRSLQTHQTVALALGLALMGLCLLWSVKAIRTVTLGVGQHKGKEEQ